jgi:hypothetical protein
VINQLVTDYDLEACHMTLAELTVAPFILTAWYPGSDNYWPALAQTTIE